MKTRVLTIIDRKDPRKKAGNDQKVPLLNLAGYDAMKPKRVHIAFELARLPLACLLPTKEVTHRVKSCSKYQSIAASIDEVGPGIERAKQN